MDFESQTSSKTTDQKVQFAEPPISKKTLEIFRDTEALIRRPAVAAIIPVVPRKLGKRVQRVSFLADDILAKIAEIDLDKITDLELQQARIQIGLSFVGFGALMVVVLLLYLKTINPELSTVQQMRQYWYEYIWFVCLGVAGMFLLGREAMRPRN